MSDKCFFDSNILVYMQDAFEPDKQRIARNLFAMCNRNHTAVISTQCLQEFYNITVNKKKLDKLMIKQMIHIYASNMPVVQITPDMIESAIDISAETQFSFWDSLILSAAISFGCNVLYSEDLNSGQVVQGITIKNPFA
ncbi:MAG: PIN domain-containing protein [Spirochaetaceae bacterium]|nr:PIN domain-containing protein [Spirochaetaceae bacterium]